MAATDKAFTGSIPEIYERYLVPLIFEFYAADLAGRVARLGARNVLEIAAGTGVVTRAMAARLPAEARITATDLNQPMLDLAAKLLPDSRVTWRQADAQALPFDDGAFDAAACQFGAMFFPDKIKAYREAKRVLKAGGSYIFNVWDEIANNEFADEVTRALAKLFPDDPPRFMARTPHGYHDVETIRGEVSKAGFAKVAIDAIETRSHAANARDVAIAYCQGTPLRSEIEARNAARLEEATKAATEALARRFGNGPIEGRIRAHIVTAS